MLFRSEANHHPDHVLANRILSRLQFINQLFELLLAIRAILLSRFEGCGYLLDVLDVFSDCLLLGLDCVQTSVDAASQAVELLLFEAPFFSSKFRWIDARTSFKAPAISFSLNAHHTKQNLFGNYHTALSKKRGDLSHDEDDPS